MDRVERKAWDAVICLLMVQISLYENSLGVLFLYIYIWLCTWSLTSDVWSIWKNRHKLTCIIHWFALILHRSHMCPWVTLLHVDVIRIHITVTCARNADTAQNKITGILPIREDTNGVCVWCIWVTLTLLRLLAWDTFVTQKIRFSKHYSYM